MDCRFRGNEKEAQSDEEGGKKTPKIPRNVYPFLWRGEEINEKTKCLKERPMSSYIKKWGNCAAVRVPASFIKKGYFKLDEPVFVRYQDGQMIVEPSDQYRQKAFRVLRQFLRSRMPEA